MAIYDQVFVFINGALASEATSVNTEIVSDVQRAMTIAKGFAGITPGPHVRTVSIESLVPVTGFEFDFETSFLNSEQFEIGLQLGGSGQKTTTKGYLEGPVSVGGGVGQQTVQGIQFVGTAKAFA